jgi:hypothetical protein
MTPDQLDHLVPRWVLKGVALGVVVAAAVLWGVLVVPVDGPGRLVVGPLVGGVTLAMVAYAIRSLAKDMAEGVPP